MAVAAAGYLPTAPTPLGGARPDTAPARFLKFVSYKAAEAGAIYLEAPTRKLKPPQTCPACGRIRKKTLRERIHQCGDCGHTEPRDAASARVCLIWALKQIDSREPADAAEQSRNPIQSKDWLE